METRDRAVGELFHFMLHIFFRRIKVVGAERVPAGGALVLAGNHENGLLDPLLILAASGRPVRFLAKATFRSEATVTFGLPVPYRDLPWGTGEEPVAVDALTGRLRNALESLTVNAQRWEDLHFVEGVRGMALELAGVSEEGLDPAEVTRRLLEEFYRARADHPTELHALLVRARAYLRMLDLLGLHDDDLTRETSFGAAWNTTWKKLAVVLVGYPPALYGWLFNFLPYFLSGRLAFLAAKGRDGVATYKLYAGLVFFPLFYVAQGALLWRAAGPGWAVLAVALGGPLGLWAMRYYALRSGFARLAAATVTLGPRRAASERLREMRAEAVEALKPLVAMYQ